MDSRELRIGNLLDRGDYICEFKMIEEEGLMLEPIKYKQERFVERYIKPIPLTEEWLIKFGFELNLNNNWSHWNFGLNFYKYGDFFESDQLPIFIYLQYVHQLQNLYFALTNKELEYNG